MKLLALMMGLYVAACSAKTTDSLVEKYVNVELALSHARIEAARAAYKELSAGDIDQPGKRAFLWFRIRGVALPFLERAHDDLAIVSPPPAAPDYHALTLATVKGELLALRAMSAALEGRTNPEAYKDAYHRLFDLQRELKQWERARERLLSRASVTLAPLPKVALPEPSADPGAMVIPTP
jgi:hypothetical protein